MMTMMIFLMIGCLMLIQLILFMLASVGGICYNYYFDSYFHSIAVTKWKIIIRWIAAYACQPYTRWWLWQGLPRSLIHRLIGENIQSSLPAQHERLLHIWQILGPSSSYWLTIVDQRPAILLCMGNGWLLVSPCLYTLCCLTQNRQGLNFNHFPAHIFHGFSKICILLSHRCRCTRLTQNRQGLNSKHLTMLSTLSNMQTSISGLLLHSSDPNQEMRVEF